MKNIRWKYRASMNHWEGTIKGDNEPLLFICGKLCVTDIRPTRGEVWEHPKHYKIIDLTKEEAKQLAEDLVTGENFQKHESNRLAWEEEGKKTSRLIKEAEELLEKLKNGENTTI